MEQGRDQDLRWALHRGDSLDQIATIVEAHPEAVLFHRVDVWDSALQYACFADLPLEIVKYLHAKHHEVVSTRNPMVPFRTVFSHDSDNAFEVTKFLVNSNPFYVHGEDNVMIQFLRARRGSARLMDFMIEKYPAASSTADCEGWLPLHVLALFCILGDHNKGSTPEHCFGALIDDCPFALLAKNSDGKTPAQVCSADNVEHRRYLEEREGHIVELTEAIRVELSIAAVQYDIPEAVQEQVWTFVFPNFVPCWTK